MIEKTEKQKTIFAKITELKDQLADCQALMDWLHSDCRQLSEERDAAIERAEKAEAELELHKQIYTHSANDIEIVNAQLRGSWQANETLKKRAEKAEREVERLGEIVTECDGVECVKHDFLVRLAIERADKAEAELTKLKQKDKARRFRRRKIITKYRCALKEYANPDNWKFYHTTEGYIRWVTKLGPDLALEVLDPEIEEELIGEKKTAHIGDGTLTIKKIGEAT